MATDPTTIQATTNTANLRSDTDGESYMIPGLSADAAHVHEAQGPLIRNAWYVMAARPDVDRTLRGVRILGEPLVYYRAENGEPVVLDDRCAHRRFPLSKSKLLGDTIQCGYHGFEYATNGRCTHAPGVNIKPKFGVRSYPACERGPWLWVWMGDAQKADPSQIPFEELEAGRFHSISGYKFNPGNYLILIENLLDLTHIHFLHGADAATLETTVAPGKSLDVPDGVGWYKLIENDELGVMALWCGGNPAQPTRSEQFVYQHGPAVHVAVQTRTAIDGDQKAILPSYFRVVHALTPVDECNTHQFYMISVNEPLTMSVADLKGFVENSVFEQDVEAIGYLQQNIMSDRRTGNREFGIHSDRFGIKMRNTLQQLKAHELKG